MPSYDINPFPHTLHSHRTTLKLSDKHGKAIQIEAHLLNNDQHIATNGEHAHYEQLTRLFQCFLMHVLQLRKKSICMSEMVKRGTHVNLCRFVFKSLIITHQNASLPVEMVKYEYNMNLPFLLNSLFRSLSSLARSMASSTSLVDRRLANTTTHRAHSPSSNWKHRRFELCLTLWKAFTV